MKIEILAPRAADTRIYQYGVRIDSQCHEKSTCHRVPELRFPTKNGIAVKEIFEGNHPMVSIGSTAAGRRSYSRFRFRVGEGESGSDITGTVYVHRPIPEHGRIICARLVEQRIGNDRRHYLQFVVTDLKAAENVTIAERKSLAALDFGWYYESGGNRIAGFADTAHPSSASILSLPAEIESMIIHSETIKSERERRRHKLLNKLRAYARNDIPEELSEQIDLIRRLPVRHITSSHLVRLIPDWRNTSNHCRHDLYALLEEWRRQDKLLLQAESHLANRARNRRKKYYEKLALSIAKKYACIAIAVSEIPETAPVNNKTFWKHKKPGGIAGCGRGKAARNDFQEAVIHAASRFGTRVVKIQGCISNTCSLCGGNTSADCPGSRLVCCKTCGGQIDMGLNAVVAVWKEAMKKLDDIDGRRIHSVKGKPWAKGPLAGIPENRQESSRELARKAEMQAYSRTPAI